MTQEDKAKRYDEALHKAKRIINVCVDDNTECRSMIACIQELFPELKEESEGERIRKALIKYYSFDKDGGSHALDNITPKQILAWLEKQGESDETKAKMFLINKGYPIDTNGTFPIYEEMYDIIKEGLEKQGEQKPEGKTAQEAAKEKKVDNQNCIKSYAQEHIGDKVEPKFKVEKDKWYVCTSQYCNCIEGRNYKASLDGRIIDDYGTEYDMHDDAYRWFRPWTIQDAKDGDVLSCKGNIKNSNGIKYERICLFNNLDNAFFTLTKTSNYIEEYGIDVNIDYPDNTVPATKEQKEILFMAMANAGYTFDFEKKELKKIEQKPVLEMKTPEESLGIDSDTYNKIVDECIYGEQKPANKVEPKFKIGDNIEPIDSCLGSPLTIYKICDGFYETNQGTLDFEFENNWRLIEQKPACSEEDETKIKSIIALLKSPALCTMDGNKGIIDESIKYLKSLKDRVGCEVNCTTTKEWKPSDEQMDELRKYSDNVVLRNLYYNLKKLKVE